MPDREEKIRARAYALWERDGYAHGSHEQHWAEAERQIDAEAAGAAAMASEAPNTEQPAPPLPPKRRSRTGEAAAAGAPKTPRARKPKLV